MTSVKLCKWCFFSWAKVALAMHILIVSKCFFVHGSNTQASHTRQKFLLPYTAGLSGEKPTLLPCGDQEKSNDGYGNRQFHVPGKLFEEDGTKKILKVEHRPLKAMFDQSHDNGGSAQISESLVGNHEFASRKLQSNSAPTPSSTLDVTLSGNIWYDFNGDGTRGDDEQSELELAAIHVASKTENLVYTAFPNLKSGNFRIDVIAPGSYSIYVSKQADFTHCTGDIGNDCTLNSFVLQPGRDAELKIGLFKPAVITGRVWEAEDYNDTLGDIQYYWQGVVVVLLDSDGNFLDDIETNEYGRFRFGGLAPGIYKVQLDGSPNFVCTGQSSHNCTTQPLIASAGEETSIRLGRYKLAKVEGSVSVQTGSDEGQFYVEGALVQIYANNGTVVQSKETDQNGEYEMRSLEPGRYFILIRKPGDLSMYSFINGEFEDPLNAPRFTLKSGKLKTINAILVVPTSQPTTESSDLITPNPMSMTSIRPSPVPIPSPFLAYLTTSPSLTETIFHAPSVVPSEAPIDRPTAFSPSQPSASPTSRSFVSFAFVVVLRLRKMAVLTDADILTLESVTSAFIEENGLLESVGSFNATVTLRAQVRATATSASGGLEANIIEPLGRRRHLELSTEEDLLVELQIDVATEESAREEDLETLLETCLQDRFLLLAKRLSESSESFSSLTLERSGVLADVAAVALAPKRSKQGWKIMVEVVLGCVSCLGGVLFFVGGRRLVKRWQRDEVCPPVMKEDRDHFIPDEIDYASRPKGEDPPLSADIEKAPQDDYFVLPHQHASLAENKGSLSYSLNTEEEDYRSIVENQRVGADPLSVLLPRAIFSPTGASMLSTIPSGSFEESLPMSATDDTASVEDRHCSTYERETVPAPRLTLRYKLFGSCLAPSTLHDGDFVSAPLAPAKFQEFEMPTPDITPDIQATQNAPSPRQKASSPARIFLQGVADLDDDDDPHIITASRSMPTPVAQASNVYDVFAPPGPLGLIIDSSSLGPVVHGIKLDSPLLNLVEVGDIICALDGVDTRLEQANVLTSIMAKRMSKHRRLTIASRHFNFGDDKSPETWCEEVEI